MASNPIQEMWHTLGAKWCPQGSDSGFALSHLPLHCGTEGAKNCCVLGLSLNPSYADRAAFGKKKIKEGIDL